MEANTYHPILNISVVPRRSILHFHHFHQSHHHEKCHQRQSCHQEPPPCWVSSTPTPRPRFPPEASSQQKSLLLLAFSSFPLPSPCLHPLTSAPSSFPLLSLPLQPSLSPNGVKCIGICQLRTPKKFLTAVISTACWCSCLLSQALVLHHLFYLHLILHPHLHLYLHNL